jgi:hypothetical protein
MSIGGTSFSRQAKYCIFRLSALKGNGCKGKTYRIACVHKHSKNVEGTRRVLGT